MGRPIREEPDLVAASIHLHYEVWMLSTLAAAMASTVFGQGVINNAALESFTLHLRALLDFFYAAHPKDDDVIAEDYFANPGEWTQSRPAKTELLEDVHRRVGKEVAHLTYVRLSLTDEAKQGPFTRLARDLQAPLFHFLRTVAKERLAPVWSPMIRQAHDAALNA